MPVTGHPPPCPPVQGEALSLTSQLGGRSLEHLPPARAWGSGVRGTWNPVPCRGVEELGALPADQEGRQDPPAPASILLTPSEAGEAAGV